MNRVLRLLRSETCFIISRVEEGESEYVSMPMDVKVQLLPLMIALAAVMGVLAAELFGAVKRD